MIVLKFLEGKFVLDKLDLITAIFNERIDQFRSLLLVNLLGRVNKVNVNIKYLERA